MVTTIERFSPSQSQQPATDPCNEVLSPSRISTSPKDTFRNSLVETAITHGMNPSLAAQQAGLLIRGLQLSDNGVMQDFLNGVTAAATLAGMREYATDMYAGGSAEYLGELNAAVEDTQTYEEYLRLHPGLQENLKDGHLKDIQERLHVTLGPKELMRIADTMTVMRMDRLVDELRSISFDPTMNLQSAAAISCTELISGIARQLREVITPSSSPRKA